jgi:hypothetical protein
VVCFCLVPCGQGFGRRLGKGFTSPLLPFALLRLLAAWHSSSRVHIGAVPSHLSCHVAVVRGERGQVWSKLRRPTRSRYVSYIIPGWQLRAPPPQTLCCVTEATKEAHGSPTAPHQASQAAGTRRPWEEKLLPAAHVLRPRRLASTHAAHLPCACAPAVLPRAWDPAPRFGTFTGHVCNALVQVLPYLSPPLPRLALASSATPALAARVARRSNFETCTPSTTARQQGHTAAICQRSV